MIFGQIEEIDGWARVEISSHNSYINICILVQDMGYLCYLLFISIRSSFWLIPTLVLNIIERVPPSMFHFRCNKLIEMQLSWMILLHQMDQNFIRTSYFQWIVKFDIIFSEILQLPFETWIICLFFKTIHEFSVNCKSNEPAAPNGQKLFMYILFLMDFWIWYFPCHFSIAFVCQRILQHQMDCCMSNNSAPPNGPKLKTYCVCNSNIARWKKILHLVV